MWFNSTINEEPYQGFETYEIPEKLGPRKTSWTGDAWPSSVRGLNCSLQWGNERNPYRVLYLSHETALSTENGIIN